MGLVTEKNGQWTHHNIFPSSFRGWAFYDLLRMRNRNFLTGKKFNELRKKKIKLKKKQKKKRGIYLNNDDDPLFFMELEMLIKKKTTKIRILLMC